MKFLGEFIVCIQIGQIQSDGPYTKIRSFLKYFKYNTTRGNIERNQLSSVKKPTIFYFSFSFMIRNCIACYLK